MSASFHFKNGQLYCENTSIDDLFNSFPRPRHQIIIEDLKISTEVPATPAYIYSSSALQKNVQDYKDALAKFGMQGVLGYAVKANGNLNILKTLKEFGVNMLVTVSGNEMLLGLKAGFRPNQILLNGNGKQSWEIKLAIEQGVLLNVDSIFDAERIASIASENFPETKVKVFLRLRPSSSNKCDVGVHPFVNTSDDSKFGFSILELDQVLKHLNQAKSISIIGIHCHLGSSITKPEVFTYLGTFVSHVASELNKRGIFVEYLDVGGGVGIDYHKVPLGYDIAPKISSHQVGSGTGAYSIEDFMKALSEVVPKDIKILVEPGRSLVGDAGVLVTKVLGSKNVGGKRYMVVDAAMSELIRPCLYGSHHQIYPTKITKNTEDEWLEYDVVGPICESSDFLGKNVGFQSQPEYIAIMDCGAYGASMASNYNMRAKATEVLITGNDWEYIRRRDLFDDLMAKFI